MNATTNCEVNATTNCIELTFRRVIPARSSEVFDAWLSPECPGTPWNMAEKLSLDPKVDGLFYWRVRTISHYGRFTKVDKPVRIEHTWVSPNTLGLESLVTVTFEEEGANTIMTLAHSGIPDTPAGRMHERGWNQFLDRFSQGF